MSDLVLKNLTKAFGKQRSAVDDLSIAISEGEFIVFFGPSGCGKTTALRMIAGLERPTSGDITVNGISILNQRPSQRRVAMVPQDQALYPHLNIRDNLLFGIDRDRQRGPESRLPKRMAEAAALLEIEDLLDRKPAELSGGERQRVAIGRAIMREPFCFLFDEPLSHLDVRQRHRLQTAIKAIHEKLRTTMIYVTHDLREAMMLADRLVVMKNGKALQIGCPLQLYNTPDNLAVAVDLSNPPMNEFSGTVQHNSNGRLVFLTDEANALAMPTSALNTLTKFNQQRILVGVRPHDLVVPPAGVGDDYWQFSGIVRQANHLGSSIEVMLDLGSNELLNARFETDCNCKVGDRMTVSCPVDRIHTFDASPPHSRLSGPESSLTA